MCPVCGYEGLDDPAYEDSAPSYEICVSCGFQFGVSDTNDGYSFEEWRTDWIRSGCQWQSAGVPAPAEWDGSKQLRNLNHH